MSKKMYKSRMLWANTIVAMIGVAQIVHDWLVTGDFSSTGFMVLIIGLLNFALRLVTKEAIK